MTVDDVSIDTLRRIYGNGILFVWVWSGDKPTDVKTRRGFHNEVVRGLMKDRARSKRETVSNS